MFDTKSLAEGALSKLPGAEVESVEVEADVDELSMAAEDVMAAFKASDAAGLKSALMSFMDLYQAPPAMPGLDE